MKRSVLALLAGAMLAVWLSAGSDPLVRVGTHSLQLHREGNGLPVVVIDTGLADPLERWQPLQARLARVTTVVTYNRAGYGKSEPGPLPRDGGREADELESLLEKASIPGPYILVGHSLGGLNAQIFASRHPGQVAGLLLLDPPPLSFLLGREYGNLKAMAESMTGQWQRASDLAVKSSDPETKATAAFFRMIASEHREMFGSSADQLSAVAGFGDLPLTVMASGFANPAFGPDAAGYQKYWIEQSRALSRRSTRGTFILAANSSHALHLDAPDQVAGAVLALVKAARGESGGGDVGPKGR